MAEEQKSDMKTGIISTIILVAVGAVIFFVLRDKKRDKEYDYYAYFSDVKGLARSSEVMINGVRVGKISDVQLTENRNLKVVITTKAGIQLPEGTVASLSSGGMTGDKIVKLVPGKGPNVLPDKATLITNMDTSVLPMSVRITPMLKTAKLMLKGSDSALRTFNLFMQSGLISNTAADLIYLEKETRSYAKLSENYNRKSDAMVSQINSAAKSANEAANSFKDVRSKINNAEQSTQKLANKQLGNDVRQLQGTLQSLNKNLRKLDATDDQLGRLVHDKKIYTGTNASLDTLNRNLQATYDDPPGFTIFGSSKKKK